jgi:hypothetical protein
VIAGGRLRPPWLNFIAQPVIRPDAGSYARDKSGPAKSGFGLICGLR